MLGRLGKIWVNNISAHSQNGNITMDGLHDIGTDPARAGTIYSTTLNTTNLHATHFTPANIGSFALTGDITCADGSRTIGGGIHPLAGVTSASVAATNITCSNHFTPNMIYGYQLLGNITLDSTHDIGTGAAKAGTIYATNLNHADHQITNIHATNIHTYSNFIAHNSGHTNGMVQFDSAANKSYFMNSTGDQHIIEVDAGANFITFKNKDGVRVMDMDMSNAGLIRIFSTHTDHRTTPLLIINNGLEFGNAGLYTWGTDAIHKGAAGTTGGQMYIDSGFLKVNTTGWT